jgi:hypothetical protein
VRCIGVNEDYFLNSLYLVVYADDKKEIWKKTRMILKKIDNTAYYFLNSETNKKEIIPKAQIVRMEEVREK